MQLISEDLGIKLEKVTLDMLGQAKRVTVSKDDTIILYGAGDRKAIQERCEEVHYFAGKTFLWRTVNICSC